MGSEMCIRDRSEDPSGPLLACRPATSYEEILIERVPKGQFFDYFFAFFPYIWPLARPNIAKREAAIEEKAPGRVRDGFGMGLGSRDFVNAGFWRLKAPETSIWAPEGAFWAKKAIFHSFVYDCSRIVWIFWVSREAALAADLITA